jgi:hypothetical protein
MSTTTLALMSHLAKMGGTAAFQDNLKAGPAAAQATATPVIAAASRFTSSPGATASALLRDILTQECPDMHWVMNDTGATMNLYPFGSQTINGAGTPLTIANGGFAFLVRIRANLDWRGAVFT